MCPVNSQNDEKLDYAFSLANACAVARSTRIKLLLTSGGRAAVYLVSDCQKHYCRTIDFRKRRRAKRKVTY